MHHEQFDRATWQAAHPDAVLTTAQRQAVYATVPSVPAGEVEAVYLPLAERIRPHIATQSAPFLIGVTGSVASGKSIAARLLEVVLTVWANIPKVQVLNTDGFIYPTATLEARGVMHRKGFPESYDSGAFFNLIQDARAGQACEAPLYSHQTYDRLPHTLFIHQPDVLIVEGVNVLQSNPEHPEGIRPFLDLSIYVDAHEDALFGWFMHRFRHLLESARHDPSAYLHPLTALPKAKAEARAAQVWTSVNLPNLRQHIQPTRRFAHLVFEKSDTHRVQTFSACTDCPWHLHMHG